MWPILGNLLVQLILVQVYISKLQEFMQPKRLNLECKKRIFNGSINALYWRLKRILIALKCDYNKTKSYLMRL